MNKNLKKIRTFFSSVGKKIATIIDKRPMVSFFGILAIIIILIIVGNFLRKPAPASEEAEKQPKTVDIFSIGKAPRMTLSGKVEKTGALKIVAQSPGVVQMINVLEGARVYKGQTLIGLSTNYQGGNISSVSRQLAEKSATSTEENYPAQMALIARQKEAAEQGDINADEMRAISTSSIQATRDLIALNQEILNSIDQQISFLQSQPSTPEIEATILGAKQGKAGVSSGLMGLKTALASAEYQSTAGNPPEKLSDLGKDIAIGQLQLQEKSLNLAKEVSQLNLRIAQISESLMYPASPCKGTLERVHVNLGQAINPGQPVASIVCDKNVANVVVLVSGDVARELSRLETSKMIAGDTILELMPRYISSEPTDGALHSVLFTLPEDIGDRLGNSTSIKVEVPVGNASSTASVPYVPIDAVFQTQASSILYVASQSAEGAWTAQGKEVTLGQVFGSYVEVQKGLSTSDQVILNRNVISGDKVAIHE